MRCSKFVSVLFIAGLGTVAATAGAATATDHGLGRTNQDNYIVTQTGFQEVPVVITDGNGEVRVQVNEAAGTIAYQLNYDSLAGNVTQSHIHVGQPGVAGGIAVWLCQTTAAPAPASVAATTPTCPGTTSGNVSGTLTSASVVGPTAQNVAVGDLNALITAIRAGKAYANVHSTVVPGGEIRAQLQH